MKRILLQRAGRPLGSLMFVLALLVGSLAPLAAAPAAPAPDVAAADRALAWIQGQQQADGSFPGFGAGSTADVIFAIAARGQDPSSYRKGGQSPLDFLAAKVPDLTKTAGGTAKLALAVSLSGRDPRSFGGADLISLINQQLDAASGHYGTDVTGQALTILAFASSNAPLHAQAYAWLLAQQGPEGGWSFGGDKSPGAADTNTTGLVLQALRTGPAGQADAAVQKALAYLHSQQNADGGFPYSQTDPNSNGSDANSTATVIMGLVAAGQDPAGAAWARGGKTPMQALVAFQNPSGAFRYQTTLPDDNAGATYQAVPALLGVTLPPGSPAVPVGMPTTGAPAAGPLWPVGVALALLAGGVLLRRRAVRR
jgi:hypothetical protein